MVIASITDPVVWANEHFLLLRLPDLEKIPMTELQLFRTPFLSKKTSQSEPRTGMFLDHDPEFLPISDGEGSKGVVGVRLRTCAQEQPQQKQAGSAQTGPEQIPPS